ncbi:hypothetical protein IM792_18710 [Mucilaginibacter sp. JRF]|uniref:hypothetical protein n=1 Tax=Mucilaginibacter sp. JRF TaxID=2780088 RepID=UPI0018829A13|nr:hypothetical protein [Mucilaginibacter sp. JRF]MBE9586487.1 hypothetical protein [Mucilaginibacter sp. JRF]
MNTIFKSLLITSVLSMGALNNVEKTVELSDKSKLVYNVGEDKKLNGAFTISSVENKLLLRGSYKEDQRSGNWYCFNPDGSVFLRYNYDLKKLVSLDTAAIKKVDVVLKTDDKDVKKNAMIPVPICSIEQYVALLGSEFERKIMAENKSAEGTVSADLIASVDENGKATYSAVYMAGGAKAAKKLIINEKVFDIEWIPASYQGKNIASTFTVNMMADFSSDPTKRQRFMWNY